MVDDGVTDMAAETLIDGDGSSGLVCGSAASVRS